MMCTRHFSSIAQGNDACIYQLIPVSSFVCVHCECRCAISSLQSAGGIYSLVALSPSVGCYEGGRFGKNVPLRCIQPAPETNNRRHKTKFENCLFGIKEEGDIKKRKRQAALPCISMSYDVIEGAWQGKMRVTICWREVLYDDDAKGQWVKANLIL
jgi:hypothetical protein